MILCSGVYAGCVYGGFAATTFRFIKLCKQNTAAFIVPGAEVVRRGGEIKADIDGRGYNFFLLAIRGPKIACTTADKNFLCFGVNIIRFSF